MADVKGTKISSKLIFVKEVYGEDMVRKVVGAMPLADQQHLNAILDSSWYPLDIYKRLVVTICEIAAGGDEAVYDKIGQHSANHLLKNAYKAFIKSQNPRRVLENMIPVHTMLNNPGKMEVINQGEGHCTIKVSQPPSSLPICRTARAFYKRTVELCGMTEVYLHESKCSGKGDEFCLFTIQWRVE